MPIGRGIDQAYPPSRLEWPWMLQPAGYVSIVAGSVREPRNRDQMTSFPKSPRTSLNRDKA
jgi:hypothetical protein